MAVNPVYRFADNVIVGHRQETVAVYFIVVSSCGAHRGRMLGTYFSATYASSRASGHKLKNRPINSVIASVAVIQRSVSDTPTCETASVCGVLGLGTRGCKDTSRFLIIRPCRDWWIITWKRIQCWRKSLPRRGGLQKQNFNKNVHCFDEWRVLLDFRFYD